MANALLQQMAQGGGFVSPMELNQMGQQVQQGQQRNMLFQQGQEDRQRGLAQQEQQQKLMAIREDLASYLMTPEPNRGQVWAQLAPKYGLDPSSDANTVIPQFIQKNPGVLGPEVSQKVLEQHFAPKQSTANLPIEEVGMGNGMFQKAQVGPDGKLTLIGQPYRKAADAAVDLRRDLADQKTEAAQAKAEASRQKAADTYDYTLNLIDGLRNHPGLETAVGAKGVTGGLMFGQVVPGTDAADFVARLDQLGGRQFLQAFESLKGGGQITQIEGEKATNAIARLQRSQSEKEFKAALDEFYGVLDLGLKRLRGEAPMPGEPQGAQTAGPSGRFRVVRRK